MNNNMYIRMTDKRLRTYLPRDICDRYGIKPHSVLRITGENGCIIIEPGKVIGPRDRTPAENLSYAKACVLGMNAAELGELRDVVTMRALELAGMVEKGKGEADERLG